MIAVKLSRNFSVIEFIEQISNCHIILQPRKEIRFILQKVLTEITYTHFRVINYEHNKNSKLIVEISNKPSSVIMT